MNPSTPRTSSKDFDYSKLGLKCGLEIHQQLETTRKLFCSCKPELSQDSRTIAITRFLRPTISELGVYDKAALMEATRNRKIIYEVPESICTYEIDESPPLDPDQTAIDSAIILAQMFQMTIFDEVHVNRKQCLDGSVPAGFQRTMAIATNGELAVDNRVVQLELLALEEDSSREIITDSENIVWRVDRLGIPLVEITTRPLAISNPAEIQTIAQLLGKTLRASGLVKRGLGTIRQDLNISISEGARVELKGIQTLNKLAVCVTLEVQRQLSLVEIRGQLVEQKITSKHFKNNSKNCKELFANSNNRFIKKAYKNRQEIIALKIKKVKSLLFKTIQQNRLFIDELMDRVKVIVGLDTIVHSGNYSSFNFTAKEQYNLESFLDCNSDDVIILLVDFEKKVQMAIKEIIGRLKEALEGVPEETRHVNEDGTSRFSRYLGSQARMYPDTDLHPVVISDSRVKELAHNLPELPGVKEKRYLHDLLLPKTLASQLAISPNSFLFDELVAMGVEPVFAAVTLEQSLKALQREGVAVTNLTNTTIKQCFSLELQGKIIRSALTPLLKYCATYPQVIPAEAVTLLDLHPISEEELEITIDKIIQKNRTSPIQKDSKKSFGKIMGEIMSRIEGKADGKTVRQIVQKKLELAKSEKNKPD